MSVKSAIQIVNLVDSPKKDKRYRVFLSDGSKYDFGLKDFANGTYIDHGDKKIRFNYWARHLKNHNEQHLIDNLIPSPALFSAALLWGHSTNLDKNIKELNILFNKFL
ncbi:MAG: hypothetical protein YSLV7_ORF03 [Yellowstone Lake virophage 7]|uniref:hypothetical protein n=1 Tax=Yellowstone Lake virophage 7 TaxID=1557035 RepID=UPI00053620DA|nr:MAG: hypothetical protein ASQ67_gp03 [Yellowstone Lake virophage 7]AIW01922.1 MAG: hypothetical protein YSLV7_ORF03 [Yellowstone Lake virophage 7]